MNLEALYITLQNQIKLIYTEKIFHKLRQYFIKVTLISLAFLLSYQHTPLFSPTKLCEI